MLLVVVCLAITFIIILNHLLPFIFISIIITWRPSSKYLAAAAELFPYLLRSIIQFILSIWQGLILSIIFINHIFFLVSRIGQAMLIRWHLVMVPQEVPLLIHHLASIVAGHNTRKLTLLTSLIGYLRGVLLHRNLWLLVLLRLLLQYLKLILLHICRW